MYDEGRKVWVKSLGERASVIQANWQYVGERRRASYLVDLGAGRDYLTGSDDLRPADACCDGCGRWLAIGSFNGGATGPDGEYPDAIRICFLCVRIDRREGIAAEYAERV